MQASLFHIMFPVLSVLAFAHSTHTHEKKVPDQSTEVSLKKIAENYRKVAPIFEKKCFNCHSHLTKYPWYYRIPGVSHYIDSDIKEALRHLDMTEGFPFKGHGSPEDDLKSIGQAVRTDSMPPLKYRLLHLDGAVKAQEKEKILQWIEQSQRLLIK